MERRGALLDVVSELVLEIVAGDIQDLQALEERELNVGQLAVPQHHGLQVHVELGL